MNPDKFKELKKFKKSNELKNDIGRRFFWSKFVLRLAAFSEIQVKGKAPVYKIE
ncbi:hypothetical protein PITCH_A640066 [uncultured Desulfobacterium sp.]|uniref:Uncharacterized protein n=1 Tax=uncultured Desulfobacterium sp. TaxID=201089 RepID=A0A445N1E5_9BACT|nr:hypothetical protein PITCH_A640066 [uncultured Desulfobacterium sp.]